MKRSLLLFTTFILSLVSVVLSAQLPEQLVRIVVTPDHEDWQYNTGEKVTFTVQVFYHMNYLKGSKAWYETGPEKMEAFRKDSLILDGKPFKVDGETLKSPGFLRCIVTVDYEGK